MYKFSLASMLVIASCSLCGLVAHENVEQRLTDLEKEMKDIYVKNASGTEGALFAPARSVDSSWYFDIEVLLWHVKDGGADWAIVFNQSVVDLPQQGEMKTLGFGWDWGARVGIGKYFGHDQWDAGLMYTYFGTDDSSKVNVPFQTPVGTGGPVGSPGPSGTTVGVFSAHINYNAIDLGIGKSFFMSETMMFHPHFGLKNIWLEDNYKLNTNNFVDATGTYVPVAGSVVTKLVDKNKIWGIGPHIGVDFAWCLCNNFKLVSSAEAALLQSYFQVTQNERIFVAPIGETSDTTNINLKGNMHQFVPFGRLLLGLGWDDYFNDKKQHVELSLNYELNYFWRENQMINEVNSDPSAISLTSSDTVRLLLTRLSEDLGFYGVNFTLKIDF